MEKKVILVGTVGLSEKFEFMHELMQDLPKHNIPVHRLSADRFDTEHTIVIFAWAEKLYSPRGRLQGIQADAFFSDHPELLDILSTYAKPCAVNNCHHNIGVFDYICQVEREARLLYPWRPYPVNGYVDTDSVRKKRVTDTWIGDMWPPSLIIPEPPREEIKFIPNGTNLDSLRPGYYKIDEWDEHKTNLPPMTINWHKTNPYIDHAFIMAGRRNGKTLLQAELYKSLNEQGEDKMAEQNIHIRNDRVDALAEAFRNIGNAFNRRFPGIKNVIYSGPCTIVLWEDGTKTVVRCNNVYHVRGSKILEEFDPEKGLAMAIAKKALGTNKSGSNYYDIFKKWLPKEEEEVDG